MKFDELDLDYDLLDALDAMHFEQCTPVQEQAIPIILEGHDLMACAQTGTGKTAAYLLPVISRLTEGDYPTDAINCVVMVPTHELAQQIDVQMEGFSYYLPISSLAIYGGTDGREFTRQLQGLKAGADVVIATPGRLIAMLNMEGVDLSQVSTFILDEADRMLDMGFFDDIIKIVKRLPADRQTLMFSATMPPKIRQLADTILRNPKEVTLAVSKPTEKIDQSAYVCYEASKPTILKHLFKTVHSKRVIVFASSKLKVKELSRTLRQTGWSTGEMHSDLDQSARSAVMHDFRTGKIDILVATDIVARGIDIDDITMVVNYDVPHEAEDYVHRIGRTARAGSEGKAVTFVSEKDQRKMGFIERFLGYEVRKNPLPEEVAEGPAYHPSRRVNNDKKHSQGGKKKHYSKTKQGTQPNPAAVNAPKPESKEKSKPQRQKSKRRHNNRPKGENPKPKE